MGSMHSLQLRSSIAKPHEDVNPQTLTSCGSVSYQPFKYQRKNAISWFSSLLKKEDMFSAYCRNVNMPFSRCDPLRARTSNFVFCKFEKMRNFCFWNSKTLRRKTDEHDQIFAFLLYIPYGLRTFFVWLLQKFWENEYTAIHCWQI